MWKTAQMSAQQPQLTQIVRAGPQDAFSLAALELQLNREEGKPGEQGFLARFADAWLAEADRRPAWLATSLDGRPLGAVMLYVVPGLPRPGRNPRPVAYLTRFYVGRPARRQGVGERLLVAAITGARDHHAGSLQLVGDDGGTSLFRRHGFRPGSSSYLRLDGPERRD